MNRQIHLNLTPEDQESPWRRGKPVDPPPFSREETMKRCSEESELVRSRYRLPGVTLGEGQVQRLLQFVVDRSTEQIMQDETVNNLIYEQLGEHRILGKRKCGKKTKKGETS